jgi:hypothetical protein
MVKALTFNGAGQRISVWGEGVWSNPYHLGDNDKDNDNVVGWFVSFCLKRLRAEEKFLNVKDAHVCLTKRDGMVSAELKSLPYTRQGKRDLVGGQAIVQMVRRQIASLFDTYPVETNLQFALDCYHLTLGMHDEDRLKMLGQTISYLAPVVDEDERAAFLALAAWLAMGCPSGLKLASHAHRAVLRLAMMAKQDKYSEYVRAQFDRIWQEVSKLAA